jgi:hypothetical protein
MKGAFVGEKNFDVIITLFFPVQTSRRTDD